MDFADIRKKARERSAARADAAAPRAGPQAQPRAETPLAAVAPARASGTPAAGADAGRAPAPPDVASETDALEDALAARVDGRPAGDARFTTWRPGAGPPPRLEASAEATPHADAPAPRPEDFTVLTGLAAPPGADHLAASAEDAARPAARAAPRLRSVPADPLADFFYRDDEEAPDVPLGGLAEDRPADADAIEREEYLTFLLGAEEYAVAIERVREVVKAPPITEVPRAPAHVLGVVTVRGEVVAVIDPRRRLSLPGGPVAEGTGRIVIVDAGEGACGLLVDAVASVVRLRPGSVEPCPQGLAGASAEYLAGIGRDGERLFTVLDLGALLRRAPEPRRQAAGGARAGA